ncbi:thioether cross-link-forming SCIFF peptide maturase [Thermoanaerobacter brockii subsp. lactiethylicus]
MMKIYRNNLVFEFENEIFNVPLSEPWNIYKGDTQIAPDYEKLISKKRGKINYITLYITDKCNLACTYCFNKTNNEKVTYTFFPERNIEKIIEFLKRTDIHFVTIRFFGGEPLLEIEYIEKILKYIEMKIKNKELAINVQYNVFTNGTILNDKILEILRRYNIFIFISIDGCKEMHDINRKYPNGSGSFDLVLRNAQILNKQFPYKLIVRCIFDPSQNQISLVDVADKLFNYGFFVVSIESPWVDKNFHMALNKNNLLNIKGHIKNFTFEYIKRIKNKNYSLIGIHPFSRYIQFLVNKCNFLDIYSCGAGAEMIAISTKGDIYPCHAFVGKEKFKLGNITEGITNLSLHNGFKKFSAEYIPKCKECPIRYFCTIRCPADFYFFNGDIYAPNEYRCEIAKEIIKSSFYIYYILKTEMPYQLKVLKRFLNRFKSISQV